MGQGICMPMTLKLSTGFDPVRLRGDLAGILNREYIPHFNRGYYEGDWSAVALRSIGGVTSQIYPDPTQPQAFADTPLLDRCGYFREVLDSFECPLQAVRLLRLAAGSTVKEHRDHCLSFEDGEVRFHIPVVTSPEVEFYLGGERVMMGEGECWYLNLSEPHRVANRGSTDRVHLVIDCTVNDWLRELFRRECAQATAGCGVSWRVDAGAGDGHEVVPQAARGGGDAGRRGAELRVPDSIRAASERELPRILDFLRGIGLRVEEGRVGGETVLPGIELREGGLVYETTRMVSPGDLLHEAGHLALKTPDERLRAHGNAGEDAGEEMAAIAWSYAAAVHLRIPIEVVFHEQGYRGGAGALIENFTQGRWIGVPMLQWLGLACDAREAGRRGLAPYPAMCCWLREG